MTTNIETLKAAAKAHAKPTVPAKITAAVRAAKAAKEKERAAKAKAAKKAAVDADKASPLYQSRIDYVGASTKAYGALRKYADNCTAHWGHGWWNIPLAGPVGDNLLETRKQIKAEKAALQALMESRGLANVYKPWSDVLKYVKGETSKKGASNGRRELKERTKLELTALYKAIMKGWDDTTPDVHGVCQNIGTILTKVFKVDLSTLDV